MFSKEFSCIRRDMVSGGKEVGDFLLDLMDSDRVSQYNSNLQHRNFVVIDWLERVTRYDKLRLSLVSAVSHC